MAEAEKEYISREEVLKYPIRLNHYDKEHGDIRFVYGVESVMEYIECLPVADVVEVVRCKDCKHAYINSFSALSGVVLCKLLANKSEGTAYTMQYNDFCSYGERRNDNG